MCFKTFFDGEKRDFVQKRGRCAIRNDPHDVSLVQNFFHCFRIESGEGYYRHGRCEVTYAFFIPCDVIPLAKLVSRRPEMSDTLKAKLFMKGNARFVRVGYAGVYRFKVLRLQKLKKSKVQLASDTRTALVLVDIYRRFHSPIVRTSLAKIGCMGVAYRYSVPFGDDKRIFFFFVFNAMGKFLSTRRVVFKRYRSIFDVMRVYLCKGRCVIYRRNSKLYYRGFFSLKVLFALVYHTYFLSMRVRSKRESFGKAMQKYHSSQKTFFIASR